MAFILLFTLISAAVCAPASRPGDCTDVYDGGHGHSGVHTIYPDGPVQVYCDMGCDQDSVRWTVIQRRQDGSVDFYRDWYDYKYGFGKPSGEYWLGLEKIHVLTQKKNYELKIDMEDSSGDKACVYYSTFSVGPENEGYKLKVDGFREGRCGSVANVGDSLIYHDGATFTAFDKDEDEASYNCAEYFRGAWWHKNCHFSNLNGVYGNREFGIGINWKTWKGFESSLKSITMKIRPKP